MSTTHRSNTGERGEGEEKAREERKTGSGRTDMESGKGSRERQGIERKVTVEAKSRKNMQETKVNLFIRSQIIYSFKICLHKRQFKSTPEPVSSRLLKNPFLVILNHWLGLSFSLNLLKPWHSRI